MAAYTTFGAQVRSALTMRADARSVRGVGSR
jgi:hypothetical protein